MSELRLATTTATLIPRQGTPPREGPGTGAGETGSTRVAIRPVIPTERLRLLFGLPIAALTLAEVVDLGGLAVQYRTRMLVGVLNAAKVVNSNRDAFLLDSLLECDVLLADGQSVVWASRVLGRPLPERVAGIDLFTALLDLADRDHRRVYLLGASRDVLDRVLETVAERWPRVVVAGSRDGYFEDTDAAQIASEIRASRADMLFLGMTSPKKEVFLGSYAAATGVPLLHGVGGSFDVLAGVTRRAPLRWQRWGLEWAYRLIQEPRRLWRRYLVTNSDFIGLVLRERLRQRPALEPSRLSMGGKTQ